MNNRELYDLLILYPPYWNKNGDLISQVELTAEVHSFWKERGELVICKVNLVGERKFRDHTMVTEAMYGKKTLQLFWKTADNTICPIFQNIELLAGRKPVTPPSSFIIISEDGEVKLIDINDVDFVAQGKVKHYLQIAELWQSLEDNAEDSNSEILTFLYRKKMKIEPKYDVKLLSNEYGGLSRYQRILSHLSDDAHKDAKPHILQNALVSLLYHLPESKRFESLLKNFEGFTVKFDDAYHAYVVGFSFDDLRKEYEERYREYMVKINDLISSSLMKALMIPGALYLTATRTQAIQTSKGLTSGLESLVVNMGIAIAVISVFMIYWCILCNERKSLKSIGDEFESLMGRLEEKSPHAVPKIKTFKENIENRLESGKTYFWILSKCNILALVMSLSWVVLRCI